MRMLTCTSRCQKMCIDLHAKLEFISSLCVRGFVCLCVGRAVLACLALGPELFCVCFMLCLLVHMHFCVCAYFFVCVRLPI